MAETEEKGFLVERAQTAARRVMFAIQRSKGGRDSGRGGKTGGRGRGGGRGGGRNDRGDRAKGKKGKDKPDSSAQNGKSESTESDGKDETQAGEKRKRVVEPDGGPHMGTRGVGVPTIISSKKSKMGEES